MTSLIRENKDGTYTIVYKDKDIDTYNSKEDAEEAMARRNFVSLHKWGKGI